MHIWVLFWLLFFPTRLFVVPKCHSADVHYRSINILDPKINAFFAFRFGVFDWLWHWAPLYSLLIETVCHWMQRRIEIRDKGQQKAIPIVWNAKLRTNWRLNCIWKTYFIKNDAIESILTLKQAFVVSTKKHFPFHIIISIFVKDFFLKHIAIYVHISSGFDRCLIYSFILWYDFIWNLYRQKEKKAIGKNSTERQTNRWILCF